VDFLQYASPQSNGSFAAKRLCFEAITVPLYQVIPLPLMNLGGCIPEVSVPFQSSGAEREGIGWLDKYTGNRQF
jgi:hypothetical protein